MMTKHGRPCVYIPHIRRVQIRYHQGKRKTAETSSRLFFNVEKYVARRIRNFSLHGTAENHLPSKTAAVVHVLLF